MEEKRNKVVEIKGMRPEELKELSDILPECYSRNGYLLLGALDESNTLCGVLAASYRSSIYEIVFLYVIKENRRQGIGTRLVQEFLGSLYKIGEVHPVQVVFSEENERNGIKEFLMAQGNFIAHETDYSYTLNSNEWKKMLHYERYLSMKSGAERFFSQSSTVINGFLAAQRQKGMMFLADLKEEETSYESNLCLCSIKDEQIISAVFVKKTKEGHLRIAYLYAERMNVVSLRSVLVAMTQVLTEKYPDAVIEVETVNSDSKKLIREMFPEDVVQGRRIERMLWNFSLKTE